MAHNRIGEFLRKVFSARLTVVTGVAVAVLVFGIGATFVRTGYAQPDLRAGRIIRATLHPVRVVGTLTLTGSERARNRQFEIELPDAKVTLQNTAGQVRAAAVTRLDGAFTLLAPAPGSYRLCWEIAGQKGCPTTVKVGKATTWAGQLNIRSERPVVIGRVLTGDGRPCWVSDSFFGLDVYTTVTAANGAGPTGTPVRANIRGEYALMDVSPGPLKITAKCEAAKADGPADASNVTVRADLTLPNHAPRLMEVAAWDGTKAVTRVAPSAEVKLRADARDQDGDSVEYIWRTVEPTSALSGGAGSTQAWKTPAIAGRYSVYLMARDGKGGYAYKRFDLVAGDGKLDFSGRVVDEVNKAPLAGATVTVGSAQTTTNAQGAFRLRVAPVADDRYVLNVDRTGYATLSRVFDRSAEGNTYEMIVAQTITAPAGGKIVLEDRTSSGPCGVGKDGRAPTVRRLAPQLTVNDRGKDERSATRPVTAETVTSVNNQKCTDRGAQIVVPAGSLVGANGQAAQGDVTASIATVNPARRALPGDYQAVSMGGQREDLLSFGAVYASFKDSSGRKLNLQRGATAEIRIPVSDRQKAVAKPKIAFWSYDERTGRWIEEGSAKLQNTPSGPMYVGKTKHFSYLNMDVATDPAAATCLRFELSSDFSAWSNLVMRAYLSYNGDSVKVKETPIDSDQYHAVLRIPYGTSFPPNTVRLEIRGTFNGQQVVLLDNIVNTDARPKMTGTNLWPSHPYTECGDPLVLTIAPGVVPQYGDIDATGRPAFLTGPFGDFNPAPPAGVIIGEQYYAAIGAAASKLTLGDWWNANGFGPNGQGGGAGHIRASYLNHNDLGFGRDMHCLQSGANLACYVTNYGLPDQNLANADAALAQTNPGATVTMEYNAAAPADRRVQFYVYGGGVASAPRLNFADLDGMGPKPVPHLCAVCHGGQPPDIGQPVLHARFREFDLPSFKYPGSRSWDFGQATLTPAELGSFAALNQRVQGVHPGTPIGDLIGAWYSGGFGGNPAPVQPAVPAGWNTQQAAYHNIYGKSCRTCHIARDEGDPNAFFVFNSSSNFISSFITSRVCGSGTPKRRTMPNAVVTYKNFWADSSRVAQFEILNGLAAGSCGS